MSSSTLIAWKRMTSEEYSERSEAAHEVLGILVFFVVCTWGIMIIEQVEKKKPKLYYTIAGILTMSAGVFLGCWIFALPGANINLIKSDLVQLQHLAMAFLLITAGLCELFYLQIAHSLWLHDLWFLNLTSVGILFLSHPHHQFKEDAFSIVLHVALGFCFIFGSFFAVSIKKFHHYCLAMPRTNNLSWGKESYIQVILAGIFFGTAALLLVAFREGTPDQEQKKYLLMNYEHLNNNDDEQREITKIIQEQVHLGVPCHFDEIGFYVAISSFAISVLTLSILLTLSFHFFYFYFLFVINIMRNEVYQTRKRKLKDSYRKGQKRQLRQQERISSIPSPSSSDFINQHQDDDDQYQDQGPLLNEEGTY
mmetsp:Transcript_21720/g.28107  ORF Transcript_21720/g.28107 Transcript_21720/m.28107 type:complete len:366 (+) Transcript_21720:117-1214(+)